MKKYLKFASLVALLALVFSSCRTHQEVSESFAYTNFGTTLVNASPSGLLTIKSWGSGADEKSAVEEALRNAVSDVLFKGFPTSKSYMASALVTEVNARERYAGFFDQFLAPGGPFLNFVKEASKSDNSRIRSKSNGRENYCVTVIVDRNALKAQLISDGILK